MLGFKNATIRHDHHIQTRPGHDNPADYLSRHPTYLPPSDREQKIAEEYINYILSTPKAMTIDEVAMETAKDKTLTTIIQAILTNKWHSVEDGINKATFHTLHANHAELSLAHKDSIILKGHRIVLPEALQNSCQNSTCWTPRHCENHGSPPRKGLVQKHAASSGRKHQELPHLSGQYP